MYFFVLFISLFVVVAATGLVYSPANKQVVTAAPAAVVVVVVVVVVFVVVVVVVVDLTWAVLITGFFFVLPSFFFYVLSLRICLEWVFQMKRDGSPSFYWFFFTGFTLFLSKKPSSILRIFIDLWKSQFRHIHIKEPFLRFYKSLIDIRRLIICVAFALKSILNR